MNETTVGREPIQIIEIKQPSCANTFGISPCTATGTADTKCYNTFATCQDTPNFNATLLSLFFTKPNIGHKVTEIPVVHLLQEDGGKIVLEDGSGFLLAESSGYGEPLYLIPSLVSASTAPTVINVGGSDQNRSPLGQRAVLRASFQDHPHNDRIVDQYQAGRTFDAFARGSFWSKWLVRNKFHKGSTILIYDGYIGQALNEMTSREYIIDNISGPSSSGVVNITAKDILTKAIGRKAQAPAVSEGELLSDITDVQTSIIATGALIADYPATGTILIGEELITYSARTQSSPSEVTFTVTARGTDGTIAEAHDAQDTVQTVLEYSGQNPWDVVEDLLVNYAGIDPSFIPIADWTTEGSTYLPSFTISAKVVEPTSVEALVAEISEQCLFYIWWHEVDKEIKLRAIRGIDVEPPLIDDNNNIIAGTFSIRERPDRRVSQVWTHYQLINPVEDVHEARNYKVVDILADLDAESENQYGEKSVKRVFSRWLDDRNVVLDFNTKTLNRFLDTPREVKLRVDAKDRELWTGDVVQMSHYSIIDQHGEQLTGVWRIISAEEVVAGEIIEYVLDDATLEGVIVVYMDVGDPDYVGDSSDQFNGAWYSDASGLMSNGDAGQNYS